MLQRLAHVCYFLTTIALALALLGATYDMVRAERTSFYDLQAKRVAGVSDMDIAASLANKHNYDLTGALAAGVPITDIVTSLVTRENTGRRPDGDVVPNGVLVLSLFAWIFGFSFRYVLTSSKSLLPKL